MSASEKKCFCCHRPYDPRACNAERQQYCTRPFCRRASRNKSRQKWLRKNGDYYIAEEPGAKPKPVKKKKARVGKITRRARRSRTHAFILTFGWFLQKDGKRRFCVRFEHPETGAFKDFCLGPPRVVTWVLVSLEGAIQDIVGSRRKDCYVLLHVIRESFRSAAPVRPATRAASERQAKGCSTRPERRSTARKSPSRPVEPRRPEPEACKTRRNSQKTTPRRTPGRRATARDGPRSSTGSHGSTTRRSRPRRRPGPG